MIPLNFLDLPRELRDEVYACVLSSPSQSIVLTPISNKKTLISSYRQVPTYSPLLLHSLSVSQPPISLALLRTCKQISNECRGLLWKLNSLHWLSSDQLRRTWWRRSPMYQIRSVCLALNISAGAYDAKSHEQLIIFLERLRQCATKGSLEKVVLEINILSGIYCTLGFCPRSCPLLCGAEITSTTRLKVRWSLVNQLRVLEALLSQPGFEKLKMEARVNFGWGESLKRVKEGNWPADVDHRRTPPPLPLDFLKRVHTCFGGELYHQDILCFKEGKLVTKIYEGRSTVYDHLPFLE